MEVVPKLEKLDSIDNALSEKETQLKKLDVLISEAHDSLKSVRGSLEEATELADKRESELGTRLAQIEKDSLETLRIDLEREQREHKALLQKLTSQVKAKQQELERLNLSAEEAQQKWQSFVDKISDLKKNL